MNQSTYAEMMVHVPLCTNKNPKNVLVISDDAENLITEILKHTEVKATQIDTTLDALRASVENIYDVVICEMKDLDKAALAHLSRTLKEDGQVVLLHPSLENIEENKVLINNLANDFKIIMPYNIGNTQTALLASKEYHPTADIILQRSDMLDNLKVYNCDLHIAAFAMPNYIRKEYLGIIKN
jgi:spermidine synthase